MVSIIIPAYNSVGYISRAIDSALAQTVADTRIIVIDDGSVDGTAKFVREKYGNNVDVYELSHNQGPSVARNKGFDVAKGEYLALLDSDDWWDPNRLENLLEIGDNNGADIISDGIRKTWDTGYKAYPESYWFNEEYRDITPAEFVRYDLGPLHPLLRRSFVESYKFRYDPSIRYAEDFDLYYRMLLSGARFILVRNEWYYRSIRPNSLSTDTCLGIGTCLSTSRMYLKNNRVRKDKELLSALKNRYRKFRRAKLKQDFPAVVVVRNYIRSLSVPPRKGLFGGKHAQKSRTDEE